MSAGEHQTSASRSHTVTGGGGIKLHVEETGNPNARPILFIHGFSQCRLAWGRQMESELRSDFRLVAMDIRGHGLSEKPRDAYGDSRLWADDVHAVIETLRLDRPILSGWSYGGVIICDYIRFHGEERLGGINLVAAVTKLGSEGAVAVLGGEFLALVPGFFSNDAQESVTALQALINMCVYEKPSPQDLYLFLGYNVIVPPYVRQGLFSRSLDHDDLLPKLRVPTLITHGEKDTIVLQAAPNQHAKAIKHAKLSVYPNAAHAPFFEDAPRFNRELREFAQAL